MKSVPAMLVAIRGRKRWTQAQLGLELGVSWVTVCRWENGRHVPQRHFISRIRDLYIDAREPSSLEQRVAWLEQLIATLGEHANK